MVAQQVAVREPEPVGLRVMEGVPRPEPVPTIDRPSVRRPSNRRPNSVVRRRRVVSVLTALTAGTLLAALFSGATAAWWVLLLVLATWAAYLLLLHHVRRVLAEREFAALLGPGGAEDPGWEGLELPYTGADFAAAVPVTPGRAAQTWALARFVLANIAGWALSPVVFFTDAPARQDTAGHHGPTLVGEPAGSSGAPPGAVPAHPRHFRHHRQRDGRGHGRGDRRKWHRFGGDPANQRHPHDRRGPARGRHQYHLPGHGRGHPGIHRRPLRHHVVRTGRPQPHRQPQPHLRRAGPADWRL